MALDDTTTDTEVDSAAAKHIAGLLDMGDHASDTAAPLRGTDARSASPRVSDTESAEDDESEVDAAQDESSTGGDDDDGQSESDDESSDDSEPTIEPPKSMGTEWHDSFKQLPPDLQKFMVERDSEQNKVFTQRMQQVGEQRKAVEAETARVSQKQTEYNQSLNTLLTMALPELEQIQNTDWMALSRSDPAEFVARQATRDNLHQRVSYIQNQMQQVAHEQQKQMEGRYQEYLNHQFEVMFESIPEMKDPDRAKAIVNDISSTLSHYGFNDQELGSVNDARVVRVLARLAELERNEAARKSAQQKRGGAPAPRVIPPNAAPAKENNQKRKVMEQAQRLKKSGSIDDAARLIQHMI